MLLATISLPTPLSPVISTLASERATRSTSCCKAAMAGLCPTSWTCVFERIADIGLTLTLPSTINPRLLRHESFNQLTVIAAEGNEPRTEAIPDLRARRHDPLYVHIRPEARSVQFHTQTAFGTRLKRLVRLQQHARQAHIEQLDVGDRGDNGDFAVNRASRRPAPFFHPGHDGANPSPARVDLRMSL